MQPTAVPPSFESISLDWIPKLSGNGGNGNETLENRGDQRVVLPLPLLPASSIRQFLGQPSAPASAVARPAWQKGRNAKVQRRAGIQRIHRRIPHVRISKGTSNSENKKTDAKIRPVS